MNTPEAFTLEVKENGRIFLPVALRSLMGIHSGDRLIVTITQRGKAELVTAEHAIASTRGMFASLKTDATSFTEELSAERHNEAELE